MTYVFKIHLRGGRFKNLYQLYIWENEGEYNLQLRSEDDNVQHFFPISKKQVQKIARKIIKHFQLKIQKAKYVPTDDEVVEAFWRYFTGSGKLDTILRILNDDPQVKEWVKNSLNEEEVK